MDTSRSVEVAPDDRPRLLETTENFNAGWQADLAGVPLEAYRVDGWRQAFLIPAGLHGEVMLAYAPDSAYARGLGLGLLAVLVLVAVAAVPARRGGPPPADAAGLPRAAVAAPVLAATFLGGWLGALACGGAFAVVWASRRRSVRVRRGALILYGLGGLAIPLALQVLAPWPGRLSLGALYDAAAVMGPAMALGAVAAVGWWAARSGGGSAARGSAS